MGHTLHDFFVGQFVPVLERCATRLSYIFTTTVDEYLNTIAESSDTAISNFFIEIVDFVANNFSIGSLTLFQMMFAEGLTVVVLVSIVKWLLSLVRS